ncbi:octopamine receptor-like [Exaiptasia diaphana]|uniref:G-protein coupled receptors family 1 profile domain-containing protein n=1 Tax=Exaiptasia diaphana TaxID=2652724 RepID=A0A913Y301_EXADI|nr:octopamine receptor-like [Exaiptasia diaphana]
MNATNCCFDSCNPNLQPVPHAIFVSLHCISSSLAVFGNIIVLIAFGKTPSLHYTSNYFLVSLSVADLVVGLLISPLYIAITTLQVWVSDHWLYLAENCLWIQTLMATTFSLAAVSIDRYLAITRVFDYADIVTRDRCVRIIFSIWTASILFGSTAYYTPKTYSSVLWTTCLVTTFGIPLIIICLCYYKILKTARYHARQIATTHTSDVNKRKECLRNNKAAFTIGIIIGCFVTLFTPSFIFACIELNAEDKCRKLIIYRHWLWGIWVSYLSSAINPWIYAVRSIEFRKAMKRVVKCAWE